MRLRPTLLAAAAAVTPLAVRAQSHPFGQYSARGCGTSALSYDPTTRTYPRGTVLCVVGTFTFSYLPASGAIPPLAPVDQALLDGNSEQTTSAAYDGTLLQNEAGLVWGTYPNSRCPGGVCRLFGTITSFPGVVPGVVNQRQLRSFMLPEFSNDDLSQATLDSVVLVYRHGVRNDPFSGAWNMPVVLTFTAIPEPSTFALGAVGGLALAGARWRSRRRTA